MHMFAHMYGTGGAFAIQWLFFSKTLSFVSCGIVQNLLCNTAGYTESADRITRGNRRQNADDQQAMRPPFQYIFITVYGYLLSLRKKHLVVLLRVKVRFVCGNNFYKAELLRGNPVNVFRADKL